MTGTAGFSDDALELVNLLLGTAKGTELVGGKVSLDVWIFD